MVNKFAISLIILSITVIPIVLCILGIYGLLMRENKLFSALAIIFGFIIPILILTNLAKNFS